MKEIFEQYVEDLKSKRNKDGTLANPWAENKAPAFWEDCWHKIEQSGLTFDGKHITVNINGVSYDYVAYKNKMLLAYPESKIDCELVYQGDTFNFEKTNGVVDYKHIFQNPFAHKDDDIIGGYCVIKNKRGEFLTLLSKAEIDKAKRVAKTDSIWKMWYAEMCKKTVIKKAVKFHFDDIYAEMEEEDNKNYDLEQAALPEGLVNAINEAQDVQTLRNIYKREYQNLENSTQKVDFLNLCTQKTKELENANS